MGGWEQIAVASAECGPPDATHQRASHRLQWAWASRPALLCFSEAAVPQKLMLHIVRAIQHWFPRHASRIVAALVTLSLLGLFAWTMILVRE